MDDDDDDDDDDGVGLPFLKFFETLEELRTFVRYGRIPNPHSPLRESRPSWQFHFVPSS
jgi:hypothetical protein